MAEVENENCLIANRMVYELRQLTSFRAEGGDHTYVAARLDKQHFTRDWLWGRLRCVCVASSHTAHSRCHERYTSHGTQRCPISLVK